MINSGEMLSRNTLKRMSLRRVGNQMYWVDPRFKVIKIARDGLVSTRIGVILRRWRREVFVVNWVDAKRCESNLFSRLEGSVARNSRRVSRQGEGLKPSVGSAVESSCSATCLGMAEISRICAPT